MELLSEMEKREARSFRVEKFRQDPEHPFTKRLWYMFSEEYYREIKKSSSKMNSARALNEIVTRLAYNMRMYRGSSLG